MSFSTQDVPQAAAVASTAYCHIAVAEVLERPEEAGRSTSMSSQQQDNVPTYEEVVRSTLSAYEEAEATEAQPPPSYGATTRARISQAERQRVLYSPFYPVRMYSFEESVAILRARRDAVESGVAVAPPRELCPEQHKDDYEVALESRPTTRKGKIMRILKIINSY